MAIDPSFRRKPLYQIPLAEDSAADVRTVRMALREQNIDCLMHVAKDGAEAIDFIKKLDTNPKSPGLDLLILDMHLPKYDGEDILRILRSTERCSQTPVLVLTASDAPRDQETASQHSAYGFFRKPSELSDFLKLGSLVYDILSRRPAGSDSNPEADAA